MAFTTLFRTGEQVTEQMLQRLLGQQYYSTTAIAGVGTGFSTGVVGIMNGAAGADPNHFSVQADGTDTVLTIRGGWCFIVKDKGTTSFDPLVYMVESSGPVTYTVPANAQGSTRVDTICLRIDQSITPDATGSNLPTVYNVQGGASSALGNAPTDGALYFPLALVTIDNGETSLVQGDVADKRQTNTTPAVVLNPIWTGSGGHSLIGGVIAPGGTVFRIQAGSEVLTTNGSANGVLTLPTAFPNDLLFFQCSNGDASTSVDMVMTPVSYTTSAITFRAWNVFTNAGFVTTTLRCNYIAIGW